MSLSLFLPQCLTCLVRLIWMFICCGFVGFFCFVFLFFCFFEIGSKWLHTCCSEKRCFQELFKIAGDILVQNPSSLFSFSSRPAAFLLLIFASTTFGSSSVNCYSLIFVIDLSVTLEEFPNRILKKYFHICIRSSWLAAFRSAL